MLICGVTEEDVRAALEVANYSYQNLCFSEEPEPISEDDLSWRLKLSAKDLDGPGCRRSALQVRHFFRRRRIRSACWHAHRDYLYALFERAPQARVKTSIASYQGYRDFLDHHPSTAGTNIGGIMKSYRLADACNCRKFPYLTQFIPEELGSYHLDASRPITQGLRVAQSREGEEVGR